MTADPATASGDTSGSLEAAGPSLQREMLRSDQDAES